MVEFYLSVRIIMESVKTRPGLRAGLARQYEVTEARSARRPRQRYTWLVRLHTCVDMCR